MRTSNRERILDAAVRLVDAGGMTAITYEAVAAASGLTRGGLLYHFPSREELLLAIQQHMAARWEQAMTASTGQPPEQLTSADRHAAYARVSVHGATRAELLLLIEAGSEPAHAAPWRAAMSRWAYPPPEDLDDADALARFIARLAADGLWLYDAMMDAPLPNTVRQEIAERLAAVLSRPAPTEPAAASATTTTKAPAKRKTSPAKDRR